MRRSKSLYFGFKNHLENAPDEEKVHPPEVLTALNRAIEYYTAAVEGPGIPMEVACDSMEQTDAAELALDGTLLGPSSYALEKLRKSVEQYSKIMKKHLEVFQELKEKTLKGDQEAEISFQPLSFQRRTVQDSTDGNCDAGAKTGFIAAATEASENVPVSECRSSQQKILIPTDTSKTSETFHSIHAATQGLLAAVKRCLPGFHATAVSVLDESSPDLLHRLLKELSLFEANIDSSLITLCKEQNSLIERSDNCQMECEMEYLRRTALTAAAKRIQLIEVFKTEYWNVSNCSALEQLRILQRIFST